MKCILIEINFFAYVLTLEKSSIEYRMMMTNTYQNNKHDEPMSDSSNSVQSQLEGQVGGQVGGVSLDGVLGWIGRLMIASLFLVSGVMAAINFGGFTRTMREQGLPFPMIFAVLAILVQLIGGLLFTGLMPIPMSMTTGRIALIVYTILVTYFMHNPMKDSDQMMNLLKSIAIIGGLLAA